PDRADRYVAGRFDVGAHADVSAGVLVDDRHVEADPHAGPAGRDTEPAATTDEMRVVGRADHDVLRRAWRDRLVHPRAVADPGTRLQIEDVDDRGGADPRVTRTRAAGDGHRRDRRPVVDDRQDEPQR